MRYVPVLSLLASLGACSPAAPPGGDPSPPQRAPQLADPADLGEVIPPEQMASAQAHTAAPSGEQLALVNELRASGRLRAVRWAEDYAAPTAAWGPLAEDLPADPAAAALAFVQSHGPLLGLDQASPPGVELRVTHQLTRRGVSHVRLQRFQDDIPVRGDTLLLHLRDGQALGFSARLPVASQREHPARILTRSEAEARVWERYAEEISIESRLVWLERTGESTHERTGTSTGTSIGTSTDPTTDASASGPLAWEVIATPRATGAAMRFDIHAGTGEVLAQELIAATLGQVTSCVFEEKPTLAGRDDVTLAGLWVSTPNGTVVTASDGTFDATGEVSFVFEGPVCNVTQRDGTRYTYTGGPTADVCFDYFDSRFAEASAFYHVNKASRIFAERYDFHHPGTQIQVTVNDKEDHFNAFARGNELWFGKGLGIFPMSVSFDVVMHELTHFVTDTLAGGGAGLWYNQYTQIGAISEGYSDYFAASYRDDPKFNNAFQPWFGRDLSNNMVYPHDYNAESHNGGRIWGGFLWDVREALGKEVADFIAFEAIAFIPSRGDFLDGRDALLAADEVLYGGAHHHTIMSAAQARGFVDQRQVYARTRGRANGFAPLEVSLVGGYSGWSEGALQLRWSLGDGSAPQSGAQVLHRYRRGRFKPTFTVSDGSETLRDTVTIHSCQSTGAGPELVGLLALLGLLRRRPRSPRV